MPIETWADQQKAALQGRFPQWDVWYVQKFPVGYTWHARPKGAPVATINAESVEELDAAIEAASAS
jgi:hypothetical protein